MKTTTTTPGFNSRITITFGADKRGRKIAWYYAGSCVGMLRRIRMNLIEAEQLVAQGLAEVI